MKRSILALCALALAVGGCATMMLPPQIKTMYTAAGTPTPRADSALVEVFMKDNAPTRAYDVLGQVEIATENESRTLENMLDFARKEARRLGGDALVGLDTDAMPTTPGASSTYPVYNLYTRRVIGFQTTNSGPGVRRVMKALVVKWKGPDLAASPEVVRQ